MHQKCEAQSGTRVIFTALYIVQGIISMFLHYSHCFYGYGARNVCVKYLLALQMWNTIILEN